MLYIQVAERDLLEKASASCISSPSQIRICSRKCLLESIFPPLGPGFFSRCFLKLCLQQQGSHTFDVSRLLCTVLSENLPQLPDICPWPSIPTHYLCLFPPMDLFSPNDNLELLSSALPHTPSLLLQLLGLRFFHQPLFALFSIRVNFL